ncbi:hypothetical protein MCSF7_00426 [Mycoplasmopsis columbina SF7]|uniref:Uncharacterized protein n=1 Tax=Mycoplasmopsis columbina SF7 TaxID=1037410 RepID=F9UJN9_9BACT|nr:hypothetical protein [Mycoplasmopsis columbina]EGV00420.1 hypothetical protein MCSF7_00426 [Mycoplasmopsis columbina SF7]
MEKETIRQIFIDILESTPGVFEVSKNENKDVSTSKIRIENVGGRWNLFVSIIVLKNANCKNILKSISSLLRYRFKENKFKLGKLNIFIEGITND